jgi:hypothetical protein
LLEVSATAPQIEKLISELQLEGKTTVEWQKIKPELEQIEGAFDLSPTAEGSAVRPGSCTKVFIMTAESPPFSRDQVDLTFGVPYTLCLHPARDDRLDGSASPLKSATCPGR